MSKEKPIQAYRVRVHFSDEKEKALTMDFFDCGKEGALNALQDAYIRFEDMQQDWYITGLQVIN